MFFILGNYAAFSTQMYILHLDWQFYTKLWGRFKLINSFEVKKPWIEFNDGQFPSLSILFTLVRDILWINEAKMYILSVKQT